MSIENHIRSLTHTKLRHLIIKESCEMCDSKNDLHLHHIIPFSVLLKRSHNILNIEYHRSISDYTDDEIDILTHYMLGVQLDSEYLTLCDNCHTIVHSEDEGGLQHIAEQSLNNTQAKRKRKLEAESIRIKTVLVPFLENNVNSIMLNVDDRGELIKLINCRSSSNNRLLKNIDTLNQKLYDHNILFRIEEFYTEEYVKGVRKQYKSAWIIVPR